MVIDDEDAAGIGTVRVDSDAASVRLAPDMGQLLGRDSQWFGRLVLDGLLATDGCQSRNLVQSVLSSDVGTPRQ